MTPLENLVDVLVVGAGPTGLAAAISLILQGCGKVMVVDALSEGQNTSRAAVIHAHTLEVLESTGAVPALLQAGTQIRSGALRQGNTIIIEFAFDHIPSKYNFVLVISQAETERILCERLSQLGGSVIWNKKVVSVAKTQEPLKEVTFESGEVVQARYVVAADGLHSKVREATGILYTDPTPGRTENDYLVQISLIDVRVSPPPDLVHGFTAYYTPLGIVGWVPLPDETVRMVVGLPKSVEAPKNPDLEYARKLLKDRGLDLHIDSVVWGSRFRVRSRLAHEFFLGSKDGQGAIVLAGDAAHTHSPAGGQGMNIGLVDGVVAASAIKEHMETHDDSALQSYSNKRKEKALEVIQMSERMTMFGAELMTWKATFIKWFLWVIGHVPGVAKGIATQMSGVTPQ